MILTIHDNIVVVVIHPGCLATGGLPFCESWLSLLLPVSAGNRAKRWNGSRLASGVKATADKPRKTMDRKVTTRGPEQKVGAERQTGREEAIAISTQEERNEKEMVLALTWQCK